MNTNNFKYVFFILIALAIALIACGGALTPNAQERNPPSRPLISAESAQLNLRLHRADFAGHIGRKHHRAGTIFSTPRIV